MKNRIVLLIEYKMMLDEWKRFTNYSYSRYLFDLTDEEIMAFTSKDDWEINLIEKSVKKYKNGF